jgi:hypothetical protein
MDQRVFANARQDATEPPREITGDEIDHVAGGLITITVLYNGHKIWKFEF